MRALLALVSLAAAVSADCVPQWDWPTKVTNGNNYAVLTTNVSKADCVAACCGNPVCMAISWNFPMPESTDGCTKGQSCCYLKDSAEPPVKNPFGEYVHTARFQKPPLDLHPLPSEIQASFMKGDFSEDGSMVGGFTQFMHYSVTTYGNEEHDCYNSKCLPASDFAPTNVDPEQWVLTAKGMGASQICLTAHHEGGFCLWPTAEQNYSVASSPWKKDILAPFVAAARKHNMSICYYIGPNSNGWLTEVAKTPVDVFIQKQLAEIKEVLTQYGPVDRLWWDHYEQGCERLANCPGGFPEAWINFTNLVRDVSPRTMMGTGPDLGHSAGGESGDAEYPIWMNCNTTDGTNNTNCAHEGPLGLVFKPREADATIQNPGDAWFWHPKHSYWKAADIWQHFFLTWGRGDAFILNMPPNTTGLVPAEYASEGAKFGDALRASFSKPVARVQRTAAAQPCASASLTLTLTSTANAVMSREDVSALGQRVTSYTVEQKTGGGAWEALPVHGQSVGFRIVDFFNSTLPSGTQLRLSCSSSSADPVALHDFGAYMAVPPSSE